MKIAYNLIMSTLIMAQDHTFATFMAFYVRTDFD